MLQARYKGYDAFQAMFGSVAKLRIEKPIGNPYLFFQPAAQKQKLLTYSPAATSSSSPHELSSGVYK